MQSSIPARSHTRPKFLGLPAGAGSQRIALVRRDKLIVCFAQPSVHDENLVRKLILMRHADSENSKSLQGVRDHDRPVTAAGRVAARQVAEALRKEGWIPDVLICSNAVRSRQTLEEMRSALPELEDADVHFLGSLYTISQLDGQTRAHLETIVVTEADDGHRCVLCLGHNKGWEEAATSYANQHIKLGNCHAALLNGRGSTWREAFAKEDGWLLKRIVVPSIT